MSTSLSGRETRRTEYTGSQSEIAPLHAQLEAERDAIARAEHEAVVAEQYAAEKIDAAREVFAQEYNFDGEKLSGTDALERGYHDYIEALETLAAASHVLVHIGPDIRLAHRVLADAGLVTGAAPASISVRAASDNELRNLRERAFAATATEL